MAQPYTRGVYHRQRTPWRSNDHSPEGQRAGIELEIEHPQHYQNVLDALPATNKEDLRPVTETDGSLNFTRGVEIVFPPFRYSQLRNGNSFFNRALKALEDAGCTPTSSCGMHVNINTTGWSITQRAAFTAMNSALPPSLLYVVGGRLLNGYCKQYYHIYDYNINTVYEAVANSHNAVASPRLNRIELRFPAATTDPKRVRLILDYAHYLELFVKAREWQLHEPIGVSLGPERVPLPAKSLRIFTAFVAGQKKSAGRDRLLKVLRSI